MEVLTEVDEQRIARAARARRVLLARPARARPTEAFERVGDMLGLHPMAMEDTREFGQRPKVDVYESHVLVVFYTARVDRSDGPPVADPARGPRLRLGRLHRHGPPGGTATCSTSSTTPCSRRAREAEDYLVYRIFDTLTDAWYPVIDAIETQVDPLEGEVFERARREQLSRIYRLRQEVREHHRLHGRAARPLPARGGGDPQPRRPHAAARRSTCATSATTSRRSRASCTASSRT